MEIKLTRWFVYKWGKPLRQKLHQVILRSPLPIIHYYHNKRSQVKESQYLTPTYSWTLILIDAWIPVCDLITNLRKMLATKFFSSSHDEDHKASWLQNPTVYDVQTQQLLQEKDELGQILSLVTICVNTTLLHTYATFDSP